MTLKNKIKIIFVLLFTNNSSNALEISTGYKAKSNQIKYSVYNRGIATFYEAKTDSNCKGVISTREGSKVITFIYSGECLSRKAINTSKIAIEFGNIISFFNLVGEMRSSKQFSIDIVWKVSQWPLINYINQDKLWPKNIFDSLKKYKLKEKRIEVYKNHLKKEILNPKVYLPFVNYFRTMNCDIDLLKNYSDPIFYGERLSIKKSELIEYGVLQYSTAKKDYYPLFKGTIDFKIVCKKSIQHRHP